MKIPTRFFSAFVLVSLFVAIAAGGVSKLLRTDAEYQADREKQALELERLRIENDAHKSFITSPLYVQTRAWFPFVVVGAICTVLLTGLILYRGHLQPRTHVETPGFKAVIPECEAIKMAHTSQQIALTERHERVIELMRDLKGENLQEAIKILSLPQKTLQALPEQAPAIHQTVLEVPSFQQELASGSFTNEYLPLGYRLETHERVTIPLEDGLPESITIGGMSGMGKTGGLRYILSSGKLAGIYDKIFLADYHLVNRNLSLTATLGSFCNLACVVTCQAVTDIKTMILGYIRMFEQRRAGNPWKENTVLVMDEGISILSHYKKTVEKIKQIIVEGRKFGCSIIVVAQTQTNKSVPTEVRDNCQHILAYSMKRKQAYTLVQDSERAKLISTINQRGQCLYAPQIGDDVLIQVPYVSQSDMDLVVKRLSYDTPIDISHKTSRVEQPEKKTLQHCVNEYIINHNLTRAEFAQQAGIHKGLVSRFLNEGKASHETRKAIEGILQ